MDDDFTTENLKVRATVRFGHGFTDYRLVIGSAHKQYEEKWYTAYERAHERALIRAAELRVLRAIDENLCGS